MNLSLINNCELLVQHTGDTLSSNEYVVTVIKYKKSNAEKADILNIYINPHDKDAQHPFTKDGHYIIDQLIIPNLDYSIKHNLSGYCTDGNVLYKNVNGDFKEVEDVEEILEVNDSSIKKSSQDTFSICFLHKCYLNLCKNSWNKLVIKKCIKKEDFDTTLDLVWISLNAIRYNIEFGYLENAQSILEDLMSCVSICDNQKIYTQNECGCCS